MKSFLQGKRTVHLAALRPHSASPLGGGPAHPLGAGAAPGVTPHIDIVKQGDKVVRIVVTCTCGERTEIECLYSLG